MRKGRYTPLRTPTRPRTRALYRPAFRWNRFSPPTASSTNTAAGRP